MSTKIDATQWTLFDKIMYGGLGYGVFSLPSNFFVIIITCLFPPLGQIILNLEDTVLTEPPYLNWNTLKKLLEPGNIREIIYSFLLTSLFYIPGLVYVLGNIVKSDDKDEITTATTTTTPATRPTTTLASI
jgi:uncharacterized membrane protein YqaE (UPF0057 family)